MKVLLHKGGGTEEPLAWPIQSGTCHIVLRFSVDHERASPMQLCFTDHSCRPRVSLIASLTDHNSYPGSW